LYKIPHEGEVLVLYFEAHPPVHEEMNSFSALHAGVFYFTKCHTTSIPLAASCVHILEGDGVVNPQLSDLNIPVAQSVTVLKMEMEGEIASKKRCSLSHSSDKHY
jgi:hypothetical protein